MCCVPAGDEAVESLLLLCKGLSGEVGSVGRREQLGHINTGTHPSKCQAVDANCQEVPSGALGIAGEQDHQGLGEWVRGSEESCDLSTFSKRGIQIWVPFFSQKIPRLTAGCLLSHLSGFSVERENIQCVITKYIMGGEGGGQLWPCSHIQPKVCFITAQELRLVFIC